MSSQFTDINFHPVMQPGAQHNWLDMDIKLDIDWYVRMYLWGICMGLCVGNFWISFIYTHTFCVGWMKWCWHLHRGCFHYSFPMISTSSHIMFTCQMFHMATSAQTICTDIPGVIMSYIIGQSVKSLLLLVSEQLLYIQGRIRDYPQVFTYF